MRDCTCGCSDARTWYSVGCKCTVCLGRRLSVARERRLSKTSGMGMCPNVASIQLGFLPLNHILGRNAILMCMRAGGYVTFVRAQPAASPASCLHTACQMRALHCRPHAVLLHGSVPGFELVQLCPVSTASETSGGMHATETRQQDASGCTYCTNMICWV